MRAALAALRPANPRHPLPQTKDRPKALNALGTLARHPALTAAFNTFNGYILFASTLTPRQRELLVLRVATVRGSAYEWSSIASWRATSDWIRSKWSGSRPARTPPGGLRSRAPCCGRWTS